MKAKNIRPGIHSIQGKNVASVRNWSLLTELVFSDGTRASYLPSAAVKVLPARDSSGKFVARNYIITWHIPNGSRSEFVRTVTGRSLAREVLRVMRLRDPNAKLIAL